MVALMSTFRHGLALAVLLWLPGCAPLTFSEPPRIDFERYRSVRVSVNPSFTDAAVATAYFAEALRQGSGFAYVTTNPAERVDLLLDVQVDVTTSFDNDGQVSYEGNGSYRATTPTGTLVDRGKEGDQSRSAGEVVEDVLDEVALHYLAPFRL
jgi:hypothetical protein